MIFLDLKTAVFAAATELIRTQSPPILTTPLILSHVNLLEAPTRHYFINPVSYTHNRAHPDS